MMNAVLLGVVIRCYRQISASMVLLLLTGISKAEVIVFTSPDLQNSEAIHQSSSYKITIAQAGKSFESFVYQSHTNFEKPEQQSDNNHWTTFEFSGSIVITVHRIDAAISNARLFPLRHGLPVKKLNDNTVQFTISEPCKLMLESEGAEEDPLFIFADVIENNKPKRSDKNVIWFEAGKLHNIGLQYKVAAGKTVYVEGGAVVWGTFMAEDGNAPVTIKGKGIITTRSDERKPGPTNIPFSTIYSAKNDVITEGITITDPVHFCIIGRGKVSTRNVKLFAWYHQTDGWGGGDDSFIYDSFMKVFDDNVKLYGKNQKATNLVIYQQHNGAPIQLSWGGQSGQHCLAENIDIIKCWVNKKGGVGNSALLNARHGSTKPIGDITIRNVHCDQGIYQLIGIGNDKSSSITNLTLANIVVNGKQQAPSYLINNAGGTITNVVLKQSMVNGHCVQQEDIMVEGVASSAIKIICDE